jgi:F420-dependent oxidoreductase-like protein
MIEVALMIEGQNGLTWNHWKRIARVTEDLGFAGLYRSDHYTNANPPDKDSLELWVSLTWLASHTRKIAFGPLVTPISFRHPTMTARMATAVDDLSGERLVLGLGAGWQEREHNNYGWELLEIPQRFDRFEEGLIVITSLLKSDTPVDFQGDYFQLKEAILLPRPNRPGGPPILIGGNGPNRTLPLAAQYADEWTALYIPIEKFKELNTQLDELILHYGRHPSEVKRSLMTGCVYGLDTQNLEQKVRIRTHGKRTPGELRQKGLIVGTASEMVDQLGKLAEAGIQRVMLQWLDLDDLDGLEGIGDCVLTQL